MLQTTIARARGRARHIGGAALAATALTVGLAFATSQPAGALPNCGGNNDIKVAPLSCTNTRTIDGTTFTVVLDVSASGAMTVTYSLDAPRSADTPIRIRAHRGISSNPGTNEVSGTIPAGATSAVLSVQTNCGQVDVKAVFTDNGDARGRVSGPYITTADNCSATPTTSTTPPTGPTTAPPTSGTPTTAPTSAGQQTTLPGGSSTTSGSSAGSGRALPETGSGRALVLLSVALLLTGIVLVVKGRDRRTLPH